MNHENSITRRREEHKERSMSSERFPLARRVKGGYVIHLNLYANFAPSREQKRCPK